MLYFPWYILYYSRYLARVWYLLGTSLDAILQSEDKEGDNSDLPVSPATSPVVPSLSNSASQLRTAPPVPVITTTSRDVKFLHKQQALSWGVGVEVSSFASNIAMRLFSNGLMWNLVFKLRIGSSNTKKSVYSRKIRIYPKSTKSGKSKFIRKKGIFLIYIFWMDYIFKILYLLGFLRDLQTITV